jgi:hypothetical protein
MYDTGKQEEGAPNTENEEKSDGKKKKEDEIEDADFEVVD